MNLGTRYVGMPLIKNDNHLLLPFASTVQYPVRENAGNSQYKSSSHYQPSSPENSTLPDTLSQAQENQDDGILFPCSLLAPTKTRQFTLPEFTKLNLQLKHATATQIQKYLKVSRMWNPDQTSALISAVSRFKCMLATPPLTHAVSGVNPPGTQ